MLQTNLFSLGLALGITVSGSGIGVFTFNPVLNYLIDVYTWKGAFTIESSIFLHTILAGVIFKLSSVFSIDFKKVKNSSNSIVEVLYLMNLFTLITLIYLDES